MQLQERQRENTQTSITDLWTNSNFNILWFGQSMSVLGDGFALVAMPLLVLQATKSVVLMGLLTGLMGMGRLVTATFAGPMVDRFNRCLLMIICDAIRTLLYLSIPFCWWIVGPRVWLIFVAVGIGSCMDVFFDVAYAAIFAEIVQKEHLVQANGRLQSTRALSYVLGPLLAGLLSGILGLPFAIFVDACSFLVSVFSLLALYFRIHTQLPMRGGESIVNEDDSALFEEEISKKPFWYDLLLGFRFLWQKPILRAVVVQLSVFMILTSILPDLIMFHLKHDLGISDRVAGIMFGLGSIGGIIAGLSVSKLQRKFGFGACWIGGLFSTGLAVTASVLWNNVILLTFVAMSFSFGRVLSLAISTTLPQAITPNRLLGRVSSAFWLISSSFAPLGATLASALVDKIGTVSVFLLIGTFLVLLGILSLFTPARVARPTKAIDPPARLAA